MYTRACIYTCVIRAVVAADETFHPAEDGDERKEQKKREKNASITRHNIFMNAYCNGSFEDKNRFRCVTKHDV